MIHKKKLIEVALPLDAINKASAREKSIRHGHPSYLALSRYAKVRQRHYRNMLSPSPAPRLDCRDAHWTTQRAALSREFLNGYLPLRG
jgi:Protein of unknown function (DUF1156)